MGRSYRLEEVIDGKKVWMGRGYLWEEDRWEEGIDGKRRWKKL